MIGAAFLADVVVGFGERFPQVHVDLTLTNRVVSLVEEGVDVAVRAATRLPDSSVVARKIGEIDHGLFASPRCLESRGTPASPADLAAHRCIVFRGKGLTKTWKLHDDVVGVDIVPSATHVPSRVTAFRDHVAAAFRAWASSSR